MQHHLLLVAALTLGFIGAIHSYLGERYVLTPILRQPNLPTLRGSRAYMEAILRWAWHLTSIAWWGTAAVLIVVWSGGGRPLLGAALAVTFALHGLIILVKASPRHPAWSLFLLTAAAIWLGTQ